MPDEAPPTIADMYEAMRIVEVIGELCLRIASRLNVEAEVHTLRMWYVEQAVMHRLYDDAMYDPALYEKVTNG